MDQITSLEDENAQLVVLRSQASTGMVDVQRVIDAQRYQMNLHDNIRSLNQNVALVEQEIERRRAKLVVCEQGVKALEKLEGQGREAFQAEQLTRSQSRLDEFASYQHFQRQRQTES